MDGYSPASPLIPLVDFFQTFKSRSWIHLMSEIYVLGTNFSSLNCISTDAFEKELTALENDLAGVTQETRVKVTQHQVVFSEKKWRDAIQAILFERTPPIVCSRR
jgi:hypothetical protein